MAEDRYRAEDLAELVDVEYRALPIIATIAEATADNAAPLHPDWIGNVAAAFEHHHGDAARALSDCTIAPAAGSILFAKPRFHWRPEASSPISTQNAGL